MAGGTLRDVGNPPDVKGDQVNMQSTGLRAVLDAAMTDGQKMKDLSVFATQNDAFRVDTPSKHRDGHWFKGIAEKALELKGSDTTDLRGCHYAALSMEAVKPNGEA
jgi:hypothetical protein